MEGLTLFVGVIGSAIGALSFIAFKRKAHWRAMFKELLVWMLLIFVALVIFGIGVTVGAKDPKGADAIVLVCKGAGNFIATCFMAALALNWLSGEKP